MKLIKNSVTLIVPPTIKAMMCGVVRAEINSYGNVKLFYSDDSTESAFLTHEQLAAGRENFFSLVSAVQSRRPDTLTFNPSNP
jgi:hypothetical protein